MKKELNQKLEKLRMEIIQAETLVDDSTKLYLCNLEKLIENNVQNGVGIVVCGTTAETATLSSQEYEDIIKFVVEFFRTFSFPIIH